ncbi:hypothetical protein ALTERO38_90269 [Alteromonas sp. 38]|nr:hypothetical protein ALTER154_10179 [Alteromonas sp. 154]VXC53674.1 hypothetical protein ALTERO38_90269 [Alteromonas sp. 38]
MGLALRFLWVGAKANGLKEAMSCLVRGSALVKIRAEAFRNRLNR